MDVPALGKTFFFPCDRWLDKSQDDGALERLLMASDVGAVYAAKIPFEVIVYTSDISDCCDALIDYPGITRANVLNVYRDIKQNEDLSDFY